MTDLEHNGAAPETANPPVGSSGTHVAAQQGADNADAHNDAPQRPSITSASNHNADGDDDGPASNKDRPLQPSRRFTAHQKFYLFGLDGVGGMAISAGINFAIAYGMYAHQDEKHPVRLFQLPNTLAGDAGVTIIVQCIITWLIEWLLATHDLSNGSVQPLGVFREPSHPLLRWLFLLDPHHQPSNVLAKIFHQALRGFLVCIPSFILLWPICVGALTGLGRRSGGDWVFPNTWTPQFFKFVLGGVLGLLTTPLMAMFWLVKAGWEGRRERPVSDAASV